MYLYRMKILRLKEILQSKGVTGRSLAQTLGVTEATMSNLVKGEALPRKDLLIRLAAELDIDVRDLFVPTKETNTRPLYVKDDDGTLKHVGELKDLK